MWVPETERSKSLPRATGGPTLPVLGALPSPQSIVAVKVPVPAVDSKVATSPEKGIPVTGKSESTVALVTSAGPDGGGAVVVVVPVAPVVVVPVPVVAGGPAGQQPSPAKWDWKLPT